ncbi:MAG: flagellar hook-basal body complex protein [Opitutales bacterium]|nr:flagellar hook-basal body complex protein [Opitutales bacterium]
MAFGALSSGISALRSFTRGMEVIGNNIANTNTVSFKGSRIKYAESFNQVLTHSAPSPQDGQGSNVTASQVGLGVQVSSVQGLFHQGGLTTTNQKTDLAISGEGFFLVSDARNQGTKFATRGGDFRIDDTGNLVTSEGFRVQGTSDGAIGFNASVDANGNWSFDKNNDSISGTIAPTKVGDISLSFEKNQAEEVVGPYKPNGVARNSIYYTNHLISTDSNEKMVWDGNHNIGAGSMTLNVDGTIDEVPGWQTFAQDAVNAIIAQRNQSSTQADAISDQDIKNAVSKDMFHAVFSADAGTHGLTGTAITDLMAQIDLSHLGDATAQGNNVTAFQGLIPSGGTDAQRQSAALQRISGVRNDESPDLNNYSVDPEGMITFFLSDGSSYNRGQIKLVDFNDTSALIREGRNLFSGFGAAGLKGSDSNGDALSGLKVAGREGLGRIQQGALELSNVDLTEEFAQMITTQRGFQAGSRIITVSDDILKEVVNLKR